MNEKSSHPINIPELDEIMFKNELKNFVENNPKLVTMRESADYAGLFVLKYSKTVFFKNLWNRFLEECRGTVIDKDFNVVTMPFTKIYNFRVEDKAPKLKDDVAVTAYRKINGFMVAMTWHDGDLLVSTTGSLDSDFVKMAKEFVDEQFKEHLSLYSDYTFLFECVHPNDPHIIEEKVGLYLLGWRKKDWGSKVECDRFTLGCHAQALGTNEVESFETTVGELMKVVKTVQHEGFVFYTKDGVAAKVKSPHYLVCKALARKKDIMSLNKELVEEEYYPLVEHLTEIKDEFNTMEEQDRLNYIRKYLETQE